MKPPATILPSACRVSRVQLVDAGEVADPDPGGSGVEARVGVAVGFELGERVLVRDRSEFSCDTRPPGPCCRRAAPGRGRRRSCPSGRRSSVTFPSPPKPLSRSSVRVVAGDGEVALVSRRPRWSGRRSRRRRCRRRSARRPPAHGRRCTRSRPAREANWRHQRPVGAEAGARRRSVLSSSVPSVLRRASAKSSDSSAEIVVEPGPGHHDLLVGGLDRDGERLGEAAAGARVPIVTLPFPPPDVTVEGAVEGAVGVVPGDGEARRVTRRPTATILPSAWIATALPPSTPPPKLVVVLPSPGSSELSEIARALPTEGQQSATAERQG